MSVQTSFEGFDLPQPAVDERGLARFGAIRSSLRSSIRVFESSSRDDSCVWVQVQEQPTFDCPSGPEAKVRLTLEDAAVLHDQLLWFVLNRT